MVSLLVFPELSLTANEPQWLRNLRSPRTIRDWHRLAESARRHRMEIVVGAPLRPAPGTQLSAAERPPKPALGAIVFGHCDEPRIYRKMHLGGDEPEYFEPGDLTAGRDGRQVERGLAICADSSTPIIRERMRNRDVASTRRGCSHRRMVLRVTRRDWPPTPPDIGCSW